LLVFGSFTLKNTGDSIASSLGFYLSVADLEGEVTKPSGQGLVQDWFDLLTWGATTGEGLSIVQNVTTTQFQFGVGDKTSNAIPLSIGPTTSTGISPGESVEITFKVTPPSSETARRLYFQIDLIYEEA